MFAKTIILSLMAATTAFAASATNVNGDQFITGPCQGDLACETGCCAFNTGLCANSIVGQEAKDGGCGFGNAESNDVSAQGFNKGLQGQELFNFVKDAVVSGQIGPGKLDVAGVQAGGAAGGAAGGNATANAAAQQACGDNQKAAAQEAADQEAADQEAAGQEAAGQEAAALGPAGDNLEAAGNGKGEQFITGGCIADADCASECCSKDTRACAARDVAEEGSGCGFVGQKPVKRTFIA